MDYQEYITPEMAVLVPVLYGIGRVLKDTAISDRHIPALLTGIAVVLTALWTYATRAVSTPQDGAQALFVAICQGVLTASCAVYANEIIKQAKK